jgi:hypothetical protein
MCIVYLSTELKHGRRQYGVLPSTKTLRVVGYQFTTMAHVFASPRESIPSSMVDQWNMETKRRIAEAKVTSDAIQRWKDVKKGTGTRAWYNACSKGQLWDPGSTNPTLKAKKVGRQSPKERQ